MIAIFGLTGPSNCVSNSKTCVRFLAFNILKASQFQLPTFSMHLMHFGD